MAHNFALNNWSICWSSEYYSLIAFSVHFRNRNKTNITPLDVSGVRNRSRLPLGKIIVSRRIGEKHYSAVQYLRWIVTERTRHISVDISYTFLNHFLSPLHLISIFLSDKDKKEPCVYWGEGMCTQEIIFEMQAQCPNSTHFMYSLLKSYSTNFNVKFI